MSIKSIFQSILLSFASLFFFHALAFAQDSCASLLGSCEYYSCVEAQRISCGETGYALGYGQVYCEKFTAMSFAPSRTKLEATLFPADGGEWRDEVRSCLQEKLEEYFAQEEQPTCSSLRTFAFASHPYCYTKGPSFCELSPENVVRIGLTIKLDLLTGESVRQIRDTAAICDGQLGERLTTEKNAFIRWQLAHYRGIWQLIARDPLRVNAFLDTVRP